MKGFISFVPADADVVRAMRPRVRSIARQFGIEFWGPEDQKLGQPTENRVLRQIASSDVFILFLSNDYIGSQVIHDTELPAINARLVTSTTAIVLPVAVEQCRWEDITPSITPLPRLDNGEPLALVDWKPKSQGMARLELQLAEILFQHLGRSGVTTEVATSDDHNIPPPPDLPAQGIGPHFQINAEGQIDLTPAEAVDQHGNHLPTLQDLHPELRDLVTELSESVSPTGNRAHPILAARIAAYRDRIDRDLAEVNFRRLYAAGVRLANGWRETQAEIATGERAPLLADEQEALDSLLRLHGTFIQGTAAGREAIAAEEYYQRTPDEERTYRADAIAFAERLTDTPAVITPEAAQIVAGAAADIGQGPHPERSSILGRATMRGVAITAIAGTTVFAMPAAIGAAVAGTTGAIVGAAVGLPAVEALKKSEPFQRALEPLTNALNELHRGDVAALRSAVRARTERLRGFVRACTTPLRRIVGDGEEGSRLQRALTWIEEWGNPIKPDSEHEPQSTQAFPDISDPLSVPPLPPAGFDQEVAERMFGEGRSAPEAWWPHVHSLRLNNNLPRTNRFFASGPYPNLRRLELAASRLLDASPLASLGLLKYLALSGIQVSDIAPLAGLTALQRLFLDRTQVSDIAPLAGLIALQSLYLNNTQVSDIAPLAGLTALQTLDLDRTQVSDIAPLAGLIALQSLYLNGTQVSDIAPLAGLTALQTLYLTGTQGSDIAPLAGLTALQELYLTGTQVSDIAPLAGLTALQTLYLTGTQVSDIAPLAGLTALQTLYLTGTQVSDIAPLAGLTALQTLYLTGTQVSDIAPLAGLTRLRRLDLTGTRVTNSSPVGKIDGLRISGP